MSAPDRRLPALARWPGRRPRARTQKSLSGTFFRSINQKSATGPDRCPIPDPARRQDSDARPARWLAWPVDPAREAGLPAEPRLVAASSRVFRHVTAKPERHSSHLNRSVRDPSGSGSRASMAGESGGVDEMVGCFFVTALRHRHAGLDPASSRRASASRETIAISWFFDKRLLAPAEAGAAGSRIKSGMTVGRGWHFYASSSSASEPRIHTVIHQRMAVFGEIAEWILWSEP